MLTLWKTRKSADRKRICRNSFTSLLTFNIFLSFWFLYFSDRSANGELPHVLEPDLQVTVVVMSGGERVAELQSIFEYYLRNVSRSVLPSVQLVWNNMSTVPLSQSILRHPAFTLHREHFNTLNNRYAHWKDIHTDLTLVTDDDCLILDVLSAAQVHKRYKGRPVIFFGRAHDLKGGRLTYINNYLKFGRYSFGTGQATLLKTSWLRAFSTDPALFGIRQHIDSNRPTCEDIALHMYISNCTGLPPILASAGQKELHFTKGTGMSRVDEDGWFVARERCMNMFVSEHFGARNPLRYSEKTRPVKSLDDDS